MKTNFDLTLYLITDRFNFSKEDFLHRVETALQAGVTLVQVREKEATTGDFYRIALAVKALTDKYQVPLIINDRVDIALAVDADGVHIGDDEMPVWKTRELIGPDKILGVSADSLSRAREARDQGADYLGIGSVFHTSTKEDADLLGLNALREIAGARILPSVAIGGISLDNLEQLAGSGIDGISVISAIMKANDVKETVRSFRKMLEEAIK